MSTQVMTVETFADWSKALSEELLDNGQTALPIAEYGTRRTCKHLITHLTALAGLTKKQYEVSFDGEEQEFVIDLIDTDDDDIEEATDTDEEEVTEKVPF